MIAYTSAVLHIIINLGTALLGVEVGVFCSWGVLFVCIFLGLIIGGVFILFKFFIYVWVLVGFLFVF